jgi:hypothetical protein
MCGSNIAIVTSLFSVFFSTLLPLGWTALLTISGVIFYTFSALIDLAGSAHPCLQGTHRY